MAVEFGQEKSGAGSFRGSGDLCFTKAAPLFVFSQPERATDRGNERQRKHVRELFQWAARASWGGRPQTDRPWSFNLSYTWPRIEQYTDALPDTQTETLTHADARSWCTIFFNCKHTQNRTHKDYTWLYTLIANHLHLALNWNMIFSAVLLHPNAVQLFLSSTSHSSRKIIHFTFKIWRLTNAWQKSC